MRLKQLDGWLANRTFIAMDDFTVADILMTHVLTIGTNQGLVTPYQHVRAYQPASLVVIRTHRANDFPSRCR